MWPFSWEGHDLPPRALRRSGAVADSVAAHHDHSYVLPGTEQMRESAHHHMEPAIRFQIARHVGDQLVLWPDLHFAYLDWRVTNGWVRTAYVQIHPFAQQRNLWPCPFGRGLAVATELQCQQVCCVLRPNAREVAGARRKLWVSACPAKYRED
jgi:hypothetical protein